MVSIIIWHYSYNTGRGLNLVFGAREDLLEKNDVKTRPDTTVELRQVMGDGIRRGVGTIAILPWKVTFGRRHDMYKSMLEEFK